MIKKLLSVLLLCAAIGKSYSQHVYEFKGVFTPNGAGPTLTQVVDATCSPAGTTGSFGSQPITISSGTGPSQQVFQFNQNGGLQYANPSYITGTYTIHVFYKATNYAAGAFSFQKVLDFSNGASDDGLYVNDISAGAGTTGMLTTVAGDPSPMPTATGATVTNSQYYLITLVRNGATNRLNIYLNGSIILTNYDDAALDYALATNTTPLIFFRDDITATYPCEAGAGAVRFISVSNAMSDATQVQTQWLSLSAAVLPINLTDFTAQKNTNSIALQWKTSNEVNAAYYELERSFDGRTFNSITKVNAKNSVSNTYDYTDLTGLSLTSANTYYRLKSVDANGNFKYSSIVKINNGKETQISVFPNPATNFITVSGLKNRDEVRIISVDGKVLSQQIATVQSMIVNVEKYRPGTYILQVKNDTEVSQQKFVKY